MKIRARRASDPEDAGATSTTEAEGSPSPSPDRADPTLDDTGTLREFVEKIEEAIYIMSPGGAIVDGNPALLRILGADSLAELREYRAEELWTDEERRDHLFHLLEERGSVSNFEFKIRRLDGKVRWVSNSVYAHRDAEGEVVAYHGILVDITGRKIAEEAIKESEQKYRAIFENVLDIFYRTDVDGILLECSPAVRRYLGYERQDLIGQPVDRLYVEPEEREELRQRVLETGEVTGEEVLLRSRHGDELWFSVNAQAVRDEDGEVIGFEGLLRDITERKELERRLEELSVRDPLTGCYNRRYLERMRPELERPTARWGVLVMDLDNFKVVNDTYGHEEGDRVLQGVAHFVQRHGRAEDVFVRLGGDEFAMIVQAASEEELDSIAQRMQDVSPYESPAAFSIGVAYRQPGEGIEEVIARADRAMYAAKGKGVQPPTRR